MTATKVQVKNTFISLLEEDHLQEGGGRPRLPQAAMEGREKEKWGTILEVLESCYMDRKGGGGGREGGGREGGGREGGGREGGGREGGGREGGGREGGGREGGGREGGEGGGVGVCGGSSGGGRNRTESCDAVLVGPRTPKASLQEGTVYENNVAVLFSLRVGNDKGHVCTHALGASSNGHDYNHRHHRRRHSRTPPPPPPSSSHPMPTTPPNSSPPTPATSFPSATTTASSSPDSLHPQPPLSFLPNGCNHVNGCNSAKSTTAAYPPATPNAAATATATNTATNTSATHTAANAMTTISSSSSCAVRKPARSSSLNNHATPPSCPFLTVATATAAAAVTLNPNSSQLPCFDVENGIGGGAGGVSSSASTSHGSTSDTTPPTPPPPPPLPPQRRRNSRHSPSSPAAHSLSATFGKDDARTGAAADLRKERPSNRLETDRRNGGGGVCTAAVSAEGGGGGGTLLKPSRVVGASRSWKKAASREAFIGATIKPVDEDATPTSATESPPGPQSNCEALGTGVLNLAELTDSPQSGPTTVMLRNIPNKYTQQMLLDVINCHHFAGVYDFFYLPMDFRNKCNVGYAFINFIHPHFAELFWKKFNGFKLGAFKSHKVCAVTWGRVQGLKTNIEHYRNSAVMSISNAQYKPMLFQNGMTVAWPDADGPLPTVKLRPQKY